MTKLSRSIFLFLIYSIIGHSSCIGQQQFLYKQVDSTKLYMEVYSPDSMDNTQKYPAVVFFFGGGWNGGNIQQFEPQAKYLAKRGMVCFLADYRVKKRQGTTPFESLKDAKSAIRFIRKNQDKFHIDTLKVVAAGGSAGGHLAAATAFIADYNEPADDLSISCIPNALLLFNPVIDNGPGGYGFERIGEAYKQFSPLHNIHKGAPPTIFFLGTKDQLIPVETAKYYKIVMEKVGSQCDLKLYEGGVHGFFNEGRGYYKKIMLETDAFLQSIHYLKAQPLVKIE